MTYNVFSGTLNPTQSIHQSSDTVGRVTNDGRFDQRIFGLQQALYRL